MFKVLWKVALAAFLILWGLLSADILSFSNSGTIVGIIAIAAGVLILVDK